MDNQKEMTSDQRFMVWSAVMESEDQKYAARAAWRQQESHYASLRQENEKLREALKLIASYGGMSIDGVSCNGSWRSEQAYSALRDAQTDAQCVSKDDAINPPPSKNDIINEEYKKKFSPPLLVRPDKEQEEESEEEFCEKVEELNSASWKKIASLQSENEELDAMVQRYQNYVLMLPFTGTPTQTEVMVARQAQIASEEWAVILKKENTELRETIDRQCDKIDEVLSQAASLESRLAAKGAECEKLAEALDDLSVAFKNVYLGDFKPVKNSNIMNDEVYAQALKALDESKHPSPPSPHPSAK